MTDDRTCAACGEPLVKRRRESPQYFALRRCCSRACGAQVRHLGRPLTVIRVPQGFLPGSRVRARAREHALCSSLARNPVVDRIYAAPGNAGMREYATLEHLSVGDIPGIAEFCERESIDLLLGRRQRQRNPTDIVTRRHR